MNSEPLMEELLSIEELFWDDEVPLWLDVEVAIRPVTRTLCPTQFCRLMFLPSGISV